MPVTINKDNSISINGFTEGIGQSTLSDFTDMMGIDISSNPNVASLNYKMTAVKFGKDSQTVTFNDALGYITSTGSVYDGDYALGVAVKFSTTGALPTGVTAGTIYYLTLHTSETVFKITDTLKKSIDQNAYTAFSGSGTGVHTMTFINPSKLTYVVSNNQDRLFALDSKQRLWFLGTSYSAGTNMWYLLDGNTGAGLGSGSGLIYYKGYLLVFFSSGVDALKDIQSASDALVWKKAFQTVTMSNGNYDGLRGAVPYLSISEDSIYFANGAVNDVYQIGLVEENAGKIFNPTDTLTFSFVADVVTVPYSKSGAGVNGIKEIENYLVISTYSDKLFFWDKKSVAFNSFLQFPEDGIFSIETMNNTVYVFTRNGNNIYACNTNSYKQVANIPEQLYQIIGEYGLTTMTINYTNVWKRELLFSVTFDTAKAYPNAEVENYLMSFNLDTHKLVKKNISSFGQTTDRNGGFYGMIHLIYTYKDNIMLSSSKYTTSTDKFEYIFESLLSIYQSSLYLKSYDNYEPYIKTGLISIGDVYNKKTLRELGVSFLRPLTTGQGIKVYYRRDDNIAWTLLKEVSYSTNGAIKDIKVQADITDIIDLQFKVNINGYNAFQKTGTTPYLKSIRLIP